jgi:carbonic anhydrase
MASAYPKVLTVSFLLGAAGLLLGANVLAEPPTEKTKKSTGGHGTETASPAAPAKRDDTKTEPPAHGKAPEEIVQDGVAKKRPPGPKEADEGARDSGHDEKPNAEPAAKRETKPGKSAKASVAPEAVTADEALKMLEAGNARWVADQDTNPNTETERRADLADKGQTPFATILTCADSRIPVERVFDRGVGDVFVVRVAGNVVGDDATGTIEYGAEHLHVPLLVIMGHTKCGAVAAAASAGRPGGSITQLVDKISPAVARTKQQHPELEGKELAAASVKENVWQSVFDLVRTSSNVRGLIREHKLRVVGAVYDVASGKVEWIGEHPWQDALVNAFDAKDSKKTETAGAEKPEGH